MADIVELQGVCKVYGEGEGAVHALREVSLSIAAGELVAVAGPSGSGKSTLLNLIGALDRPSSGTVRVDGVETSRLPLAGQSRLRRDRIGFVFQAYNLIPVLTAFENAEYVLALQGRPPAERREKVMQTLKTVGLEGLERRFPRELSGGQQQRVAIARAIAAEPALVLADEPTANVDSKTGAALLDLMVQLNREKGVTFLFSTHDPAVMQRAGRTLVLHDGRLVTA
ncbi:MAG: ABC transporter ATP-binding protein [Myxococcaceae bacterium]